jgi:hypothetical protein
LSWKVPKAGYRSTILLRHLPNLLKLPEVLDASATMQALEHRESESQADRPVFEHDAV